MPQEIELKLCAEPSVLRRLLHSEYVQSMAQGSVRRLRMQAVYFDTPEGDLAKSGLGLRLRQEGRRWRQTVKTRGLSQSGLHSRAEFETPATRGQLDPERLLALDPELLAPLRRAAFTLQPLFHTRFVRHALQVERADGTRAELAFDFGEIEAGDARLPISELEIELLEGSTDSVFALALDLLEHAPLRIENRSKAQRGMALRTPTAVQPRRAEPPLLGPEATPRAAAAQLLGEAMAHFEGNEAGARTGEQPEFLHQARVALRRMRSLLRLLKPLLPAPLLVAMESPLRDLGRALGACRDWDVFAGETLVELASGLDRPDWVEPLQTIAQAHRASALESVREALLSRAHQRMKLEFGRMLEQLQQPVDFASEQEAGLGTEYSLREFARRRLRRSRRRLQRSCADLVLTDNARVHAVRLEIKKLRYACEALGDLFPAKRVRSFVQRLAQAQAELGHFNDAAVAQRLVDGLDDLDPLARGVLHGFAAARTLAVRRQLPQLVARIERARRFW